ncbi:MAG: MATE family efflux transporter [Eubacteriales bacterium]|nr:MATE family efflux transporter [Eubacteriales bacterium]
MSQEFMREKKVLPLVLSMSLPMMLSMLVNSLYNIVDSMFVAQLGEDALTAVSLVYPLQTLVTSIGVGFGVGISAAAAFFLGAGDRKRAGMAASQGFLLSIVHGVILSLGLSALLPAFLGLFYGEGSIYELGLEYGRIVMAFSVVVTVQIGIEKIYQSMGNMIVPTVCLAAGCLTNIVLDPFFIFGIGPFPRLEVTGAAIATVIGQMVTLAMYAVWYAKKGLGIEFGPALMRPTGDICKRLYLVGVPSSLTLGLPSLLVTLLNGMAGAFSSIYVLILGVYFKLQTFIYLPASGIVQGMRPVLSYNYGAGEKKRMKQILGVCTGLDLAIMAVGMAVFFLLPGPIMRMFTKDAETIREGAAALRLISLGFVISGISVTASGALEALGEGVASFIISFLRYLALIVPLAWLGSRLLGVQGIWAAFPAAETLTALAASAIFFVRYKKLVK